MSAYRLSDDKKITATALSDIYKETLGNVEKREEGFYRKKQTFMLNAVSNPKVYNPTSPDEILTAMEDIERYLRVVEFPDVLTKAALAHYQFEAIHPFELYNGIVGRILLFMVLRSVGLEAPRFMSLSEVLYDNKNDYFYIISSTQRSGGYMRLIKFLIRGIYEAASRAIVRIDEYERTIVRDEVAIQSQKISTKHNLEVYNYFRRRLVSKIKPIAEDLGVSFNTVSKSIDALIGVGVLRAEGDQSRHRYFLYNDVLEIFIK